MSKSDDEIALQYRIDEQWAERMKPPTLQFGCFYTVDGSRKPDDLTKDDCVGRCVTRDGRRTPCTGTVWKQFMPSKSSTYLYSGTKVPPTRPPELMARIAASALSLPAVFLCKAQAAMKEKGSIALLCEGSPQSMLRLSGGGAVNVNAGDTVSVPLANAKRDPQGVLLRTPHRQLGKTTWLWTIDAALETVDVAEHAPNGLRLLPLSEQSGSPERERSAPQLRNINRVDPTIQKQANTTLAARIDCMQLECEACTTQAAIARWGSPDACLPHFEECARRCGCTQFVNANSLADVCR